MEEIEKLKEELINVTRELKIEHLALITAYKRRHYCYKGNYDELYVKQKNMLNKLNQLRLKHWYWK